MRVLIVTSPNEKCGIREHSEMLMESLPGESLTNLVHQRSPSDLVEILKKGLRGDIVHIDHHAALHAAWTPEVCDDLRFEGIKVVLTQHDTYESLGIMTSRGLHNFSESADALIVHESVKGLTDQGYPNVYQWRQPVPDLPLALPTSIKFRGETIVEQQYVPGQFTPNHVPEDWPNPAGYAKPLNDPPVVGTVGFDFPWKGFELLEQCADKAGWKTRIFGGAEKWLPRDELLRELRKCDATAFLYSTGNSGTSAAIRMGIAARRPVIAMSNCRQFRDLAFSPGILWATDAHHVTSWLESLKWKFRAVQTGRVEELADMDSWTNAGKRYAALYRRLLR